MDPIAAKSFFDLPFALSMGPQQCGAGGIYDYFHGRRDIAMPDGVKETFYFDRHFQRGPEFYVSHFRIRPKQLLAMEISTTIFDHPEAPERVHSLLGSQVKLFCPLRHPVERSKAVYEEYMHYGLVRGSLREAVQEAPQIIYASRYAEHLERWFTAFGADKIKIMFAEDMDRDAEGFFTALCSHLSIPYARARIPEKSRKGLRSLLGLKRLTSTPEFVISPADARWLEETLQPEIHKFQQLTGLIFP